MRRGIGCKRILKWLAKGDLVPTPVRKDVGYHRIVTGWRVVLLWLEFSDDGGFKKRIEPYAAPSAAPTR